MNYFNFKFNSWVFQVMVTNTRLSSCDLRTVEINVEINYKNNKCGIHGQHNRTIALTVRIVIKKLETNSSGFDIKNATRQKRNCTAKNIDSVNQIVDENCEQSDVVFQYVLRFSYGTT